MKGFLGQPSYQSVCQGLHTALGGLFVVAPAYFLGWSPWAGAVFAVAWIGAKEGVYDRFREGDSPLGSLLDGAFYAVGMFIALGLCWLTGKP